MPHMTTIANANKNKAPALFEPRTLLGLLELFLFNQETFKFLRYKRL